MALYPIDLTHFEIRLEDSIFQSVHEAIRSFRARYWNTHCLPLQKTRDSDLVYIDIGQDIDVLRETNKSMSIPEKLIIREEYREMYQMLLDHQEKPWTGHIVSGHPGIGALIFSPQIWSTSIKDVN